MESPAHIPVLIDDVLELLAPRAGALYCDGTLGRGGHTRALLERSAPDGRVVAVDRDPEAIAAVADLRAEAGDRLLVVHGRFGDLPAIMERLGLGLLDGILLDLGVSSPQLDVAERGFSFTRSGPIDMRMDPTSGPTALELIHDLPQPDLAAVLRDLGEERLHQKIARRLKEAAKAGELGTTLDLARTVASCFSSYDLRRLHVHPATRTFQALRIAVNRELDELQSFLATFPDLLAPGGRCVVISFHSLEDRLVKRRFRELAWTSSLPPKLAQAAGERIHPVCTPLTRKPVFADDDETDDNPRARSARLRACQRTEFINAPATPHR